MSLKGTEEGVMEVGSVGVLSTPCMANKQMMARKAIPAITQDDGRQMVHCVWVKAGGQLRTLPYSITKGIHAVTNCVSFSPFDGRMIRLGASAQSMFANMAYLQISNSNTVVGKWKSKRSMMNNVFMNHEEVDALVFHSKHRPAEEDTWDGVRSTRKKRARPQHGVKCESCMHKRMRHNSKEFPFSEMYTGMKMCMDCYGYNVLKTEPGIDDTTKTGDLNSRSILVKDLLLKTKDAALPILQRISEYKVTDMISSIDPGYFAPSEEREHHAVAMMHSWQMFVHVYNSLASAYAICQQDVLLGFRRFGLSKESERHKVMLNAAQFVAENGPALSTFGRASVPRLQGNPATEEERAERWSHGWVHADEGLNGMDMHNRHELLIFDRVAYTRGFAMVVGALASGCLKINLFLVPPAVLPPAAGGVFRVSCRDFIESKREKTEPTHRCFPDECVDADCINYEEIAWMLTNHRRAASRCGMDEAPELTLNLFGSLTKAARGETESFGDVTLTRGAVFIELFHMAMSEYAAGVTHAESIYTDTVAYAAEPDGELTATLIRHERKMIDAGGGADVIARKLRRHEEHNNRATGDWDMPCIPMSEELYCEFGGMVWPNENPAGWMGIDDESVEFGNAHIKKK
jgi:hypothetical protein